MVLTRPVTRQVTRSVSRGPTENPYGQVKNLLFHTQEFDNPVWTAQRLTPNTGITDYKGVAGAYELQEDSSVNSTHRIFDNVTLVAGRKHTLSILAKGNTRDWIYLRATDDSLGSKHVWFDSTNGVVGIEESGLVGAIYPFANSWYRLVATISNPAASQSIIFGLASGDGNTSYTGDGSSSLYIDRAMLNEGGLFPYVPGETP